MMSLLWRTPGNGKLVRGKLSDRTNFKFFGAQSFVLSGSKLIPLLYNGGVLMNYYLRSGDRKSVV